MSISTTTNRVTYDCNGSLTEFDFSFKIFSETDLKVCLYNTNTYELTELTLTTHYSVSTENANYDNGGTVTTVETYSGIYQIIIIREVDLTQESDYEPGEDLPADVLEDDLDKRCMAEQQLNEQIGRQLAAPVSDSESLDMTLPVDEERAGNFLMFDENGEPVVAAGVVPEDVAVSAFAETLLDDANAAEALGTLGFPNAYAAIFKGFMSLVITQTGTTQPVIPSGQVIEINGEIYLNTEEITISGTTADTTWYDILLTPSGTTFTASFVARGTGVWSDSKKGLYSGNNRVVGCVYRIASDNWDSINILQVINKKITICINIGDWNMDSDITVDVPHGLGDDTKIRMVKADIYRDLGDQHHFLDAYQTQVLQGGIGLITDTDIRLERLTGGIFDTFNYDNTSFNRGRMTILYEV